ncbi:MAG: hypothetical protein JW737_08965, partial [Acidobacteria bacterium]|nr:hypothetical protein [Acidobacteriota bacterium]
MKNFLHLLLVIVITALLLPAPAFSDEQAQAYKNEIAPYVKFLKSEHQTPVDYVMGLFEKNDIVILCERSHNEATQYDLIYDIVSDKRFIKNVGHIFTEIGSSSNNQKLHDYLFVSNLSEQDIEKGALNLYRNLSWGPLWDPHSFFDLHKKLYRLNKGQPDKLKINMYYLDMPFSWNGMTPEKYKEFRATLPKRDEIMANQFMDKFKEIKKSDDSRKKALVIMNYRHAFNNFKFADGTKAANFGMYLFEEFPGKVANVMINPLAILPGTTDSNPVVAPIHGGKWDAAFEVTGNRETGFDFDGSPFGEDYFDYYMFIKHDRKYKDVFKGYIFYKPLKEQRLVTGIPGLFNNGYDRIILNRFKISGNEIKESEVKEFISENEA